jgi:tetratricopeptide (TPR) repeat protein
LHLRALAGLEAPDAEMLRERGRVYAEVGLWDRALADYARAFTLAVPEDAVAWREQAQLCLQAADQAGYARACRGLLERFGRTPSPEIAAQVALACAAGPGDGADPREPLRLARKAVRECPRAGLYRHILALACYRAGRYGEACDLARAALGFDPDSKPNALLGWLTLALATRAAGQAEESQRWRERAERQFRADEQELARTGEKVPRSSHWWHWLAVQQLRAELRQALVRAEK